MIGIVAAILGFQGAGGLRHLASNVAGPAPIGRRSGEIFRVSSEFRHARVAVEVPTEPEPGPGDGLGERPARLESRPWRLSEHADAIRQPDDGDGTGDASYFGVIDLVRSRAFDWRAQNRAEQHVRHLHVDAVARGAVDLG